MHQDFNDKPFEKIYSTLEGLKQVEPEVTNTGIDKIDDRFLRVDTIHEAMNYVEQARRFLKGAQYHDSGEAYQMADDSIDDLQQKLQILTYAYPEPVGEARDQIPDIWTEKRKVYDELTVDPDGIVDREYNQVLLDIAHQGMLKSTQENKNILVDNPHYRPTYWTD